MSIVLQILVTLLVLSVLVMVHELGHYTAGRLLGFTITEFALGMGPRVCGFKKNGTEYNLRVFPIGGMCQFFGEDAGVSDPRCFNAQKPWKRAIVIAAGPVMNFVLAFVLAMVMYMGWGTYDGTKVEIREVFPDSPAMEAGLEAGDMVLSAAGVQVNSIESLTEQVDAAQGEIELEVRRGRKTLIFTLAPRLDAESGRKLLGLSIGVPRIRDSFFEAVAHSASYCWEMAGVIFKSFGMFFTGEAGFQDMSGMVGVTRMVGQVMAYGADMVVALSVFISVNLGIMNLLPIPALDGGRLMFILIEWVRGKPVPPEKEGIVHLVGFVLLMVLMVALVVKDVWQWINGVGMLF